MNPCTEYITFDVVDMLYPYNTIFERDLLNTFEATLHLGYLYLKIPTTFNVISVFGSQEEARNIDKGLTPGHKNVHFPREEPEQHNTFVGPHNAEALTEHKKAIKAEGEFKKVPLDPRVPDKALCIGAEATQQEQTELLGFLDKNNDVFAWSIFDLVGVSRDIIEHQLQVSPSVKPKK
jgi:hypothetical protein